MCKFCFKIFLLVVCTMFTDVNAWAGQDNVDDSVFNGIYDFETFFSSELQIIEERVRQDNPELVESMKDADNDIKLIKYNNWYAQKVFDQYRNLFLWKLDEDSKKTGRSIKSRFIADAVVDYQYEYWLDRGKLDTKKCNGGTYQPKDTSEQEINKLLVDERKHTCFYPDGFEEHAVFIKDEGDMNNIRSDTIYKSLSIIDDYKEDGKRIEIDINLNGSWDWDRTNQLDDTHGLLSFSVAYDIYDYDEYHNYRNQEQQDIKNGMWSYLTKEDRQKDCTRLWDECPVMGIKNPDKWKSSISPSWYTKSVTIDTLRTISHSK